MRFGNWSRTGAVEPIGADAVVVGGAVVDGTAVVVLVVRRVVVEVALLPSPPLHPTSAYRRDQESHERPAHAHTVAPGPWCCQGPKSWGNPGPGRRVGSVVTGP